MLLWNTALVESTYYILGARFTKVSCECSLHKCKSQMVAASPFTNDFHLQTDDKFTNYTRLSYTHGSQVWCLISLIKHLKINTKNWWKRPVDVYESTNTNTILSKVKTNEFRIKTNRYSKYKVNPKSRSKISSSWLCPVLNKSLCILHKTYCHFKHSNSYLSIVNLQK